MIPARLATTSDGTDPSPPRTPVREEVFEVLSNRRRQYVLHYLKRNGDEPVRLRNLVDQVAAWENDTTIEELESNDRKCVYTALRQSHLPKLDAAGVVNYDKQRGEVELTDGAEEVQLYLEYVPANDIPWCYYYLGLSAVLTVILGLATASIFPFAELTGTTVAGLSIAVVAFSAVVHAVQTRRNALGSTDGTEL